MRELAQAIRDVDALLHLEPEELGARLLFLAKQRLAQRPHESGGMIHPRGMEQELYEVEAYRLRWNDVSLALAEAWAWVEAQGLIVPAEGTNGSNGWRRLSRRARKFESEVDAATFAAASRLPRDAMHPKIAATVWSAFLRGEYDVAVSQAMKAVEVSVREAAGFTGADYGGDMIMRAFNDDKGPLRDPKAQPSERAALRFLFMGVYGFYRNPLSHRDVRLDDPMEAMEVVMFANHLLRIVERRREAGSCASP